jgi:ring-1,2-phenylacetyl-CoA epoxidase subunit PaaC
METAAPAPGAMDERTAGALADLLLAMADDEFVLGFFDSEWTGIAPLLEEDVAFSSLAQDEIGHARALFGLRGELTGEDPDQVAYGRQPGGYRHTRLLDERGPEREGEQVPDWAFSVARRYLYDTADAARLDALARSSYAPLAGLVAKMRREEVYHLAHMDAWLERLARAGDPAEPGQPSARQRLVAALEHLWPDAYGVLAPVPGEDRLLAAGILPSPMASVRDDWLAALHARFQALGLPFPFHNGDGTWEPGFPADDATARTRPPGAGFRWLWREFTSVWRSDPGAAW